MAAADGNPSVTAAPVPTWAADHANLWQRFHASGDAQLRAELVVIYAPFARMIASRIYRYRGRLPGQFCDYLQAALLGLLEAMQRYDPALGVPFHRYAGERIRGAVLNALPAMSELHAQACLRKQLDTRVQSLSMRPEPNSKEPDSKPAPESKSALQSLVNLTRGLSIGFLLEGTGMYCESEQQADHHAYSDHSRRELAAVFAGLLPRLPEAQADVLRYHYFWGMQFNDIATLLGLSPARISQLHRVGLHQLRVLYEAQGRMNWSG